MKAGEANENSGGGRKTIRRSVKPTRATPLSCQSLLLTLTLGAARSAPQPQLVLVPGWALGLFLPLDRGRAPFNDLPPRLACCVPLVAMEANTQVDNFVSC